MKKWEKLDNAICVSKLIRQNKQDQVNTLFFDYIDKNHRLVLKSIKKAIHRNSEDPLLALKRNFLSQYPYYRNIYYQILEKKGYHKKEDIIECISDLCNGSIEEKIDAWKQFDAIKDILVEEKENKITIISSDNESFTFSPVSSLYPEEVLYIRNKHMEEYPKENVSTLCENGYNPYASDNLEYCCHYVAVEFVKLHPEGFAVTSICPNQFEDCYWYHSFVIDEEEKNVIDIANGFKMSLRDFELLFEPNILCKIHGTELDKAFLDVLPEFKKEKQSIMSIAFTTIEREKEVRLIFDK